MIIIKKLSIIIFKEKKLEKKPIVEVGHPVVGFIDCDGACSARGSKYLVIVPKQKKIKKKKKSKKKRRFFFKYI
jgi:hypothetical protein